jgi:hypothetical protein
MKKYLYKFSAIVIIIFNHMFLKIDLEKKKKSEIIDIAKSLNIKGRSLLRKEQLINIIIQINDAKSILSVNTIKKSSVQKNSKNIIKKVDSIKTKKDRIAKKQKLKD